MVRNNKQIQIFGGQVEFIGDVFVCEVSLIKVNRVPHARLRPDQVHNPPHLTDIQQNGGENIGKGIGGGTCHAGGYVWHAIVNDIVLPEHGLLVVGDFGCFKTPALINTHI